MKALRLKEKEKKKKKALKLLMQSLKSNSKNILMNK